MAAPARNSSGTGGSGGDRRDGGRREGGRRGDAAEKNQYLERVVTINRVA
jgi:small subunit ribosomal protein S5